MDGKVHLGVADGASADHYGAVVEVPAGGNDVIAILTQDVHVCAGQDYEFSFKYRKVSGPAFCIMMATLGGRNVFASNAFQGIPVSGATWQSSAPVRLAPFQLGGQVVQGPKFYYKAQFQLSLACPGAGGRATGSTIRLDSFSLVPV